MKNILILLLIINISACTSLYKDYNKNTSYSVESIDIFASIDKSNLEEISFYMDKKELSQKEKNDILFYFGQKKKTEKDIDIFKYFIKTKIDLNSVNNNNKDIIKLLLESGSDIDLELLKILEKKSFDFKKIDFDGNNYLTSAIDAVKDKKSLEILEFMLKMEVDVNHKNIKNFTPLSYLLTRPNKNYNKEILTLLFKYGLDPNKTMGKNEETALIWICESVNNMIDISLIDGLLENGADPNILDKEGYSPMTVLILNEHMPQKAIIGQKLIDYGSDVNFVDQHGKSPLVYVTLNLFQFENQNLLPLLVSNGADINYKDENGNSLLSYAVSYGSYLIYYEYTQFLLSLGIDPNIKNNFGESPMVTVSKNINSNFIAANLLYIYGGDIDSSDIYGNTALSYAAITYEGERESDLIDYLISHGADINKENKSGYNPFMLAILYSEREKGIEALEKLLPYYSDINKGSSFDYTPLMVAAHYSNEGASIKAIDFLIKNGADVNTVQNDGTSPLMLAAIHSKSSSSFETVKKLVELGADTRLKIKADWLDEERNIQWKKGDTALDLAVKYKNISADPRTIEYLKNLKK